MQRSVITMLAAVAMALAAANANAAKVSIGGKHPRGEIKTACAAAGGRYESNLDAYGCYKQNCDGQGGLCAVRCENNGQCTGHTPRKMKNPTPTLGGILAN